MSENQPEIDEKELEQVSGGCKELEQYFGGCEEHPGAAEMLFMQNRVFTSKEQWAAFKKAFSEEA